jgi:hypothetical protein
VAKKKADKEIKRLKKKAKEVSVANLTLAKRARKLEKKLVARDQQIADLEQKLKSTRPALGTAGSSTPVFGDHAENNIASSHHSAWKQHRYLRDRYEIHLADGTTKDLARRLANEDLGREFGAGSSFTEEELEAILS